LIDLQNSHIRTLAVVEAQMTKGINRPTDYLLPFFQSVIASLPGEPFIIKDVLDEIEKIYSIEIPVYLAESLVHSLENLGCIEYDKNINCHICLSFEKQEGFVDLDQSHFDLLEEKFTRFAKLHDLEVPLASDNWQKALFNFFSNKELGKKSANFRGKLILNPKEKDDWLISKFIFEEQTLNSDVFELIKKIYAAYSIADTVASIQNIGHTKDWQGLNIVYDSTVLMRLLGTSGDFLKKATLEMHHLLLDIGCTAYYFDHNLAEVFHNIEALTVRYQTGERIHRETAQALENGEITIGNINLLKGDADTRLGKLNITQLDIPSRLSNIKAQINPIDLEEFLKKNIVYNYSGDASQVDADSIERILLLRNNDKTSEIPKSKYIFVTHNNRYAKYSNIFCKKYCDYKNHHAPPIVTLGTLTRLSWLASDNKNNILDLTNELVINCFQASLPDEKWFSKFWNSLEQTNPELLDINIHDSLYLLDIRTAAEDSTMGSSILFDSIDIPKLIENAKKNAEARNMRHEEDINNIKEKAEIALQNHIAERERLTAKAEETKNKAILESKKEIEVAYRDKITNAVNDKESEIYIRVEAKATRHARLLSKALTLAIAIGFGYVFYVSQQEMLPAWVSLKYTTYIRNTAMILGIIQVFGLFMPKISFLFLGPMMEKVFSNWLRKRYIYLLNE